jgi:hypothetical protein
MKHKIRWTAKARDFLQTHRNARILVDMTLEERQAKRPGSREDFVGAIEHKNGTRFVVMLQGKCADISVLEEDCTDPEKFLDWIYD